MPKNTQQLTQHTPGPWTVEPYDNTDLCGIYRVWEAQKRLVGDDEQSIQREEHANARLVAAAPEMLALVRQIAQGCMGQGGPVYDQARALLAKVEGPNA